MPKVVQAAQYTSACQTWCLANETCQSLIGNEEMIVSHVIIILPSHHLDSALMRFDLLPLLKCCLVPRVLEKCQIIPLDWVMDVVATHMDHILNEIPVSRFECVSGLSV